MEDALTFLRHLRRRLPTSSTVTTTTTPTSDDDPFFDLEILPQDQDPIKEEDTTSDLDIFFNGSVVVPSDPKPLSARLRFLLTEKERKLSRYLGKVRLMVLRRSGEEGKEEEKVVVVAEDKSKSWNTKQRVLLRRMRVVGLTGKGSKSAAAVAAEVVGRRDDSLLDLQEGIQSAIAHCKNSLNANLDAVVATTPEQSGNNNKHNEEDSAI